MLTSADMNAEKCALLIHAMEHFGHKKEEGVNIYYNLSEPGKCVI